VINDLVDERLCNHPAILRNAEWYRLAATAQEALWNLYQAIGTNIWGRDLSQEIQIRDITQYYTDEQ
jgi:hypothetical protein